MDGYREIPLAGAPNTRPIPRPWRIVVVGAGFSGTALAVQLLRRSASMPLQVTLVSRRPDLGRGVAYGTRSPVHLLNVPVGRMSLFPDDARDFLHYLGESDPQVGGGDFVPRSEYGTYLAERLHQAAAAAVPGSFRSIMGEAVGAEPGKGCIRLEFADGRRLEADRLALTTGNYPPADPPVPDRGFFATPLYVRDPWAPGALDGVRLDRPVLLIGTGLTMVDVALELQRRGLEAGIISLSRRGLLPQAHRQQTGAPLAPRVVAEMLRHGPARVRRYLQVLRLCMDELGASGTDWRDILGGLRPVTAELWQALDPKERRRFLRHLQPLWDTHRHRMAPSAAGQLAALQDTGNLAVVAGRLVRLHQGGVGTVNVTWRPRGGDADARMEVGAVINCTGPQSRLERIDDCLVQALLKQGLMRADSLGLGVDVDEYNALVDTQGRGSQLIYYTGPLLRARYWECTAVPELRAAAARLAERLIAGLPSAIGR